MEQKWSRDLLASLVVFLVALPLCMGIARACGMPAQAGILTGIVGGLVVGWLAGCPLQVSGPAAGLILVVQGIVSRDPEHGIHHLALAVALAGLIQLVAGLLRLGQWFRAVSPAVIEGMLAGIGVVIVAKQFHLMLDGTAGGGVLENLLSIPGAFLGAVQGLGTSASSGWALLVGLLTILVLLRWKRWVPRALQLMPAAFPAVLLATAVVACLALPVQRLEPLGGFGQMLTSALTWPAWGELWSLFDVSLLRHALEIAFVASAETLLCATAVDQMQNGPRTQYNRELAAQGVGNFLCGLLHGLPMTGVVVRSKANIEAGARTRLSAVLHGLWLLVFVSLLPGALAWIPSTALAAVLVYTGVRLIDLNALRELRKHGRSEVVLYAATLIGVVSWGLLEGVLLGLGLALVRMLYHFTRLTVRLEEQGSRAVLHLEGAATFVRLPQLAAALERVGPGVELHVTVENLRYIDHACLVLLTHWEERHRASGGHLVLDWQTLQVRVHAAHAPKAPVASAGLEASPEDSHPRLVA